LINHDLTAVSIEADVGVAQLSKALAVLGEPFGVNEQHHEASAAGHKELAAHCAGIAPGLVDFVDLGIRHVAAS
jgi:hypothetical protein